MSNLQPTVPLSECVRLGRELHSMESQRDALERENAALREMHDNMLKILASLTEDKERLDSGEIMLMVSDEKMRHVGRHKIDLRAAIDAARKEAKP